MASPAIPARPNRSNQHLAANLSPQASGPQIPPRPDRRNKDRSISPTSNGFDRSPLHGALFAAPSGDSSKDNAQSNASTGNNVSRDAGLDKKYFHSGTKKDAPSLRRPPSVSTLPSVGQEGNEYASLADEYTKSSTKPGVPEQTSVKQDLPLHAPKASVPLKTAKSRISTVTRTDSTQAAAVGIGRPPSGHDDKAGDSSRGESRSASAAGDKGSQARERGEHYPSRSGSAIGRPMSSQSQKEEYEEQGIPEIGLQVPMYPNAGDVQAPTPSPFPHQDGTGTRPYHMKRRSTREVFTGPPGSYGLRGHGVEPRGPFEKAWYEKHPDQLEKEGHGEYGPGIHGVRSEWALSSNDLNKLVHESTHGATGLGASEDAVAQSIPDEQIGYMASEEYAKLISPRPQSTNQRKRLSSSGETPLRQSFVPEDVTRKPEEANEEATEDASEDEVIHIDPMTRRMSRVDDENEQKVDEEKAEIVDYEDIDESQTTAYSAPILAADEVAKRPEAEYMQPAVPPEWERAPTATYVDSDENNVLRRSGSRPSSRPNSFHTPTSGGNPMIKLMSADEHDHSSTQLEEIHEYEPLFPSDEEDEKNDNSTRLEKGNNEDRKRKMPHRPRLDAHAHRFPSMDIWEDTPGSLQLQTVVATPQLPDDEDKSLSSAVARKPTSIHLFESPNAEEARKRKEGMSSADRTSYLPSRTRAMADPRFKPGVSEEMHMQSQQSQHQHQNQVRATGRHRPGMQHRFPSKDVWEDTPDHFRLVTTVGGPQQSEESIGANTIEPETFGDVEDKSTVKPPIPPRSLRSQPQEQESDSNNKMSSSSVDRAHHPAVPSRPKPKLPARPAKLISKDSGDQSPLSRTMSADSDGSSGSGTGTAPSSEAVTSAPPQTKPKPSLPPRPAGGVVGNKIAALKSGFMSDLNSKLKLGPAAAAAAAVGAGAGMLAGAKGGTDGDGTDSAEDSSNNNKAVTVERAPLDDARKGRAKGPAGRRRAAAAAAAPTTADDNSKAGIKNEATSLSMSGAKTVWRLNDEGLIDVPSMQSAKSTSDTVDDVERNEASNSSTEGAATPATQDTADTDDKDATGSTGGNNYTNTGASTSAAQSILPPLPSQESSASPSKMTSTAVQTGQIDVAVPAVGSSSSTAKEDKMTVYIDGAAPESGNVVVKHKDLDGAEDGNGNGNGNGNEAASGTSDDSGITNATKPASKDDEVMSPSVKDSDEVIVENRESGEERVVKPGGEKV